MQMVDQLPTSRRGGRGRKGIYIDLVERVWDGNIYKIETNDIVGRSEKASFNGFRAALVNAAKKDGKKVKTRLLDDELFVQVVQEEVSPESTQ